MLNRIFRIQKKVSMQPSRFYINKHNRYTILYQSILRNQLKGAINYSRSTRGQFNSKWLYPLNCGINVFDDYEVTVAYFRKTIEKNNGYYFFDLSGEAIPYVYDPLNSYLTQKFKSFHEMLEKYDIEPERVFFVNSNLVADKHYENWHTKAGIKYKLTNKPLTHQHSLGGYSEGYIKYFSADGLFDRQLALVRHSIEQRVKRKYYFTCLMLRPRYHRTALMLHLVERDYLSKGICSYFGSEFGGEEVLTVETEEQIHRIINALPSGKRLLSAWEKLDKLSPIHVDSTLATIKTNGWAPKELGFFPRTFIEDTSSINTRSYFEIVSETHFTDETCLYITEKTLWAIVSLQPFLIVGSPFTLQYLRELGFLTFSPYIDESYDAVSDPAKRFELIMAEIDRLCSLSIDEIHDLYSALWPRLLHNYYYYFTSSKHLAVSEIQKRIVTPINAA